MKDNEILNEYQHYWRIIKDKGIPKILQANCMRNILEYFFGFIANQDFNQLFEKKRV